MSVCLSVWISQKPQVQISRNFLYTLPLVRSSSDNTALGYVLLVLWTKSVFTQCGQWAWLTHNVMFRKVSQVLATVICQSPLRLVKFARWQHWGRSCFYDCRLVVFSWAQVSTTFTCIAFVMLCYNCIISLQEWLHFKINVQSCLTGIYLIHISFWPM